MEYISVKEWAQNHDIPERTAITKLLLDKFRIKYGETDLS